MSDTTNELTPGMAQGIASCVCAALGFFIPVLGLILSIVAIVLGGKARAIGKQNGNDTVATLGLVGLIVGWVALAVAALAALSLFGLIGGIGVLGAMSGAL